MRRKTSLVGALLIVVALFLYVSPSVTAPLSPYLGQSSVDTVFDRNSVTPVAPLNYSFYGVNLTAGDSLTVSLTTNPGNIDVLLMNQGNFSLWSSGGKVSYSTYPESILHVSNYSFSFTNDGKPQEFFVVLVSHSSTEETTVLLHAVGTRPSQVSLLLFPFVFGLIGVVVLGLGLRGGGKKVKTQPRTVAQAAPPAQAGLARVQSEFCRHCGAALHPGSQFCPSCNKSQT
ncbi:MAG: zinc ribbon domain-containing protein [Nitrososphaerota archaeon]|nr:zinc ribbon domain-containing protein [Nitrososphaerota archaeon]